MSVKGTASVSQKSISYHFDGTTEFKDGDVVTHRFAPGDYTEMLMLKLDGKHEKARLFLEAARLKGDTDAGPNGECWAETPPDSSSLDHPASNPSADE